MNVNSPLHIIHLEDDPYEVKLIQSLFTKQNICCKIDSVNTSEDFITALSQERIDLILADYTQLEFDGMTALTVSQEICPEVPFIMIFDASGDELAFETLKNGATDYIYREKLTRLIPSVCRAIQEAQEQAQLKRAEELLKEKEKQMVQTEKLASLGMLVVGVAHEINNPIGYVSSNMETLNDYVNLLKKVFETHKELVASLPTEDGLDYVLEDIDHIFSDTLTGFQKIQEIVQNLKDFARVDQSQKTEADINAGIDFVLKMIKGKLTKNCLIRKDFSQLPSIKCYPGKLNQVFMNLLINAAQAIPEVGTITIKTEALDAYISIQIADTGMGIPQENLSKLFDPFFTTKPVDQGTGMGLSISYGIIQEHGGSLEVDSKVGKGTTFTIRLPIE